MPTITPTINGKKSPYCGSFIVPPGSSAGINIDGYLVNLSFVQAAASERTSVVVDQSSESQLTIVITQAPGASATAFDLDGFALDGHAVSLHLSITSIGVERPHRVITYTMGPPKEETTTME